jgi:hypothetical protein
LKSSLRLHILSAIGLAVAVFLAFGSADSDGVGGSSSSSSSSSSSFSSRREITPEYEARFKAVSKVFTELGARVDPMDPSYPYTMRAYLPSRVAMELTDRQAKEIAGMARSRLHEDAIVYVMSEGGQQLAKATPWGIQ